MQGSDSSITNLPAAGGAPAPDAKRRRRFNYDDVPTAGGVVEAPAGTPFVPKPNTIWTLSTSTLLAGALAFCLVFGFLYWWNLKTLAGMWWTDQAWSHGMIVPLLSVYLLWLRRRELRDIQIKPAHVGLVLVVLGVTAKVLFAASHTATTHVENLSMLVVLAGATLWVLGWNFMRVAWLPISYLVFAINPPGVLYQKMTAPMQDIAANIAAKMLLIFSIDAEALGNQLSIMIKGVPKSVNVAEACSGMKMLIAFIALATVLAYSTTRPMWQKIFLVMCAFPVAIVCNGLRIAIIALLVGYDPNENSNWAHGDAHGFIGLLMLIPAMGLQLLVGWILSRIFVEEPAEPAKGAA